METKRETRPQARTRIASKVAAISNNLERLDASEGVVYPKGCGSDEEGEGQNLWPDISSGSLRVSPLGGGGIGRPEDEKHEERGECGAKWKRQETYESRRLD